MLDRLTAGLDYQGAALTLRAERQRVLASNIANADTPGYQARDIDFAAMLARATGVSPTSAGPLGAAASSTTPLSMPQPGTVLRSATAAGAAGVQPLPAALPGSGAIAATHARHLAGTGAAGQPAMLYRAQEQASGDGNSVDMDRERANFADNAVRYEATLRFINSGMRQTLSAIRGD